MGRTPRIYLDNAATSFPKPPAVIDAMRRYADDLGASPGRGGYREVLDAGDILLRCRRRLARLIGGDAPERIVFTLNCSDALNLAIRGVLHPHLRRGRAHAITTRMDHNSVLRPLNELAARHRDRLDQTRLPADPDTGLIDAADVERAIRGDTKIVAVAHASNVSGTVQPIADIGRVCARAGVPLLVDAAQTIGHLPIDVAADHIDLLAFPGHKGLLGPLGTGGLYLAPGMEDAVETVREGGTGSVSEQDTQPRDLPDKYEPGSHNAIGIAGLDAALGWIDDHTVERIAAHERTLAAHFLDAVADIDGLRVLGPRTTDRRVAVFSITIDGLAPADVADALERDHGLLTRAGLHCAPLAHQTFGTSPDGATRLSFGAFTTEADAARAADALARVAATRALARA